MISRSDKATQYLLPALKVLLIGIAFGYIYLKLSDETGISFTRFLEVLSEKSSQFSVLLVFVLLAIVNWVLEIFKWKTLVSAFHPITFKEAARQSLGALTASLATPARIGDYGAKALFYRPTFRRKIVLLNMVSNGTQMGVTILFGLIGLVCIVPELQGLLPDFKWGVVIVLILAAVLGVLGYRFKEKELLLKGCTLSRITQFLKDLPWVLKRSVLFFSILRYVTFSSLFYAMLSFFWMPLPFMDAMLVIMTMYFLVSIAPTILLLDVVVRGSVAVGLFSLLDVPELPVLCTVLAMWLLNFGLPALWGSIYVASFKPPEV